jgi:hypothetical protein
MWIAEDRMKRLRRQTNPLRLRVSNPTAAHRRWTEVRRLVERRSGERLLTSTARLASGAHTRRGLAAGNALATELRT